ASMARIMTDTATEVGPAYTRRARVQFSYYLPEDGPDAMPNQGIGLTFFHRHRPTTRRHVPPDRIVHEECTVRIAGTTVHFVPAPSDSDDTVIIHLPEHDAVVNNHLWPALFNIYTLRGEAYRDPLGLIDGLDRIRGMDPEHLVGAHGPPISGRARVREALADYRDSIQFLWDQTVRGINAGLPVEEIVARVRLPRHLAESPWVQPHYGEAAFHVRAIHAGVLGWFDMDTSRLHPLPPAEEARRMLAGFGGAQAMHRQAATAADAGDWSWAIQLATYLMRAHPEDASARALKARALRGLAQTTPAANTRSVCLTEARTLEGGPDPMATTSWRANRFQIMNAPPTRFVRAMRVQLDPDRAAQADVALQVSFTDREASCALHIKGGVARFIDGPLDGAALHLETTLAAWADIYTGRRSLAQACADGEAKALPGTAAVAAFFEYFDHLRVA
ncbi:MAG: alkyl sulfatase dimerization domain-containing protein, partial [Burkholderiales bacterium]